MKAASVAFRLRTGSRKLFHADGPATAKARQPYVLSRCRGRISVQHPWDQSQGLFCVCRRFRFAERRCLWMRSGAQSARYGAQTTHRRVPTSYSKVEFILITHSKFWNCLSEARQRMNPVSLICL